MLLPPIDYALSWKVGIMAIMLIGLAFTKPKVVMGLEPIPISKEWDCYLQKDDTTIKLRSDFVRKIELYGFEPLF